MVNELTFDLPRMPSQKDLAAGFQLWFTKFNQSFSTGVSAAMHELILPDYLYMHGV